MKKLFKAFFLFLSGTLLIHACTDPTLVGAELLGEDQVDIQFTDTLTINAKSVQADSLRTYSALVINQVSSYFFGDMKDPIIGKNTCNIYAQLRLEFNRPDFTNATLDSIVLILPYDTLGTYGDISGEFGMEVLEVTDEMERINDYYSDTSFMTNPTPLTSYDFTPSLDSLSIINYDGGVIDTIAFEHLRVPIEPTDYIKDIFFNQDTLTYDNDSTFLSKFRGIQLRPTKETEGLLSFALRLNGSGIFVYYSKDNDTIPSQYRFELNDETTRLVTYEKDYSGSVVETLLENPDLVEDSVVVVQSLAGVNIEIDIPHITDLEGIVVNKAELELTIASLEGDNLSTYEPIEQLLISNRNEDNGLNVIDDVLFAGENLSALFGGVVIENSNDQPDTYQMNLSAHIQNMIDGKVGTTFTISPFQPTRNANRTIFYGPRHPTNNIKLRISYTKL